MSRRQYFSTIEIPPIDQEEPAINSNISPNPISIQYPLAPTIPFEWPTRVIEYLDAIPQFELRPRKYQPFFFLPGYNHAIGRDQFEVYATRFDNPADVDPDTPKILPNFENLFKKGKELMYPDIEEDYIAPKWSQHSSFPTQKDSICAFGILHYGLFSQGPPGNVHGGAIATYIDTFAYEAFLVSGRKGVTASLNINYKAPTPINSLVFAIASVELAGPRKAFCRVSLFNEDFSVLYVESTIVFVTPTGWVGLEGDLKYGIQDQTKFDNSKPSSPTSPNSVSP
jgi:hypothetical protein